MFRRSVLSVVPNSDIKAILPLAGLQQNLERKVTVPQQQQQLKCLTQSCNFDGGDPRHNQLLGKSKKIFSCAQWMDGDVQRCWWYFFWFYKLYMLVNCNSLRLGYLWQLVSCHWRGNTRVSCRMSIFMWKWWNCRVGGWWSVEHISTFLTTNYRKCHLSGHFKESRRRLVVRIVRPTDWMSEWPKPVAITSFLPSWRLNFRRGQWVRHSFIQLSKKQRQKKRL